MSNYEFVKHIDFNNVETQDDDYAPLPVNTWFRVAINSAEYVPTRDGKGQLFKTRLDVVGPTHAGRVLWEQIFCFSADPGKAAGVRIGLQRFKSMMQYCGRSSAPASDQDLALLVGKEFEVKLGLEPAKNGYEARNTIKYMRQLKGAQPTGATGASAGFNDSDLPF